MSAPELPASTIVVTPACSAMSAGIPYGRQVSTALRGEPVKRRTAMADVNVNIDEARRYVEPGGVHHLARLTGGNVFLDGGNFVFRYRHVHHPVHVVRGINHMAAL